MSWFFRWEVQVLQCNKKIYCIKHMIRHLRLEFKGACYFPQGKYQAGDFSFREKLCWFLFPLMLVVKRYQFKLHDYYFINHHYHLLMNPPPPKKREKSVQRYETIKWSLYSNDSIKHAKELAIFCQADTNYAALLKYGYFLKEIAE